MTDIIVEIMTISNILKIDIQFLGNIFQGKIDPVKNQSISLLFCQNILGSPKMIF